MEASIEMAARATRPRSGLVDEVVAATRPARRFKASTSSNAAAQLEAVLAAVRVRDELEAATSGAERRRLQREHQRLLGEVVVAFRSATRKLAGGFRGEDYLGQTVDKEDLDQAVALGVAEAVARFDAAKSGGGCVYFVLARVRFALQQLTGSQRRKQHVVGLDDLPQEG